MEEIPTSFQLYLQQFQNSKWSHYINAFNKFEETLSRYNENNDNNIFYEFVNDIESIIQTHNDYQVLPSNLQILFSDCYILIHEYERALKYCPITNIGRWSTLSTNIRINLCILTGKLIEPKDILSLFPTAITKFGMKNITEIEKILKLEFSRYNINKFLLSIYDKSPELINFLFGGFVGNYWIHKNHKFNFRDYSLNQELHQLIIEISRQGENNLRDNLEIPKIGEGWISETFLYYRIKNEFKEYRVVQHASPNWLGKQHLDIYFPNNLLAIEYQGSQHFKPIDFFGGQEAFEKVKLRDQRKKRLCKKNNVNLLLVEESTKIEDLISEITLLLRVKTTQ